MYILINLTISTRGIHMNEMSTTKGNDNMDNAHNSFKVILPVLTKEYGYSNWKYNLIIREAFTLLEKEKQSVRTISVENLSSANGVKLIIEKLDKLYLEDEISLV